MNNAIKSAAAACALALTASVWAQAPAHSTTGNAAPPGYPKDRVGVTSSGPAPSASSSAGGSASSMNASGCDKLTGKTREDCLARRDAAPVAGTTAHDAKTGSKTSRAKAAMRDAHNPPLAGATPGVGVTESGPVNMSRPPAGKADTRNQTSSAGGSGAPAGSGSATGSTRR
jgi:hypothetical protein